MVFCHGNVTFNPFDASSLAVDCVVSLKTDVSSFSTVSAYAALIEFSVNAVAAFVNDIVILLYPLFVLCVCVCGGGKLLFVFII